MHRRAEILRRGGPPPHCYPISRGNLGRPGKRWRTEEVSEKALSAFFNAALSLSHPTENETQSAN
tara:strand:- start:39 stop:233 length:195 start_codon:yes stop_codon:yes gene_type:complete